MGIRQEMRQRILVPLCFGFCFTAILATGFMVLVIPTWIQKFRIQVIEVEKSHLVQITRAFASVFHQYEQRVSDDLMSLKLMYEKVYYKNLRLGGGVNDNNTDDINSQIYNWYFQDYLINGRRLYDYYDATYPQVTRLESDANSTSSIRSQWYVAEPPGEYNLNSKDRVSMLPLLKERLDWSLAAEIYLQTVYDPDLYNLVYSMYELGGYQSSSNDNGGLFYAFPLSRQKKYSEFDCSDKSYFDFLCRPWYKDIKSTISTYPYYDTAFGSPYIGTDKQVTYTACLMMQEKVASGSEKRTKCIDVAFKEILDHLKTATSSGVYYIVDRQTYKPIYHPFYMDSEYAKDSNSFKLIWQFEFPDVYKNDASERSTFQSRIQTAFKAADAPPSNTESQNVDSDDKSAKEGYFEYPMNDTIRLLSYADVPVMLSSTDDRVTAKYSFCFTMDQDAVLGGYEALQVEVMGRILVQFLIALGVMTFLLLCAWHMINYLAKRFVRPIDDLIKLITFIEDPDLEIEELSQENTTQIQQIENKKYCLELNRLFQVLGAVKRVVRYSRAAKREKNEALALMDNAMILSIYQKLEDKRGMSAIHSNLGNIHTKADRLEEAYKEYEKAIEMCQKEIEEVQLFRNKQREGYEDSGLFQSKKKKPNINQNLINEIESELNQELSTRRFQLVNCLIRKAQRDNKSQTWDQVLENLSQVVMYDKENRSNHWRIIYCLIGMAHAYLKIGHMKAAQEKLQEAEKNLQEYGKLLAEGEADASLIPIDILAQRVEYWKGIYFMKWGNKKQACYFFTSAIETGKVFDPMIRKKSLQELKKIFESQGLQAKAPNIQKLLNSFKPQKKDIIFLLDYSQSMNESSRIQSAVNNILRVFDNYLKEKDRVGFIRFNVNCDTVFGLSEAKKNVVQLRKQIEDSMKPSGGTAFYKAINQALRLHHKSTQSSSSKWIIALTDGDDNESKLKHDEILWKLYKSDVNLVVIGLALHQALIPKLNVLCRATTEGLFIDSPTSDDLEAAFQTATDVIYGSDFNVDNVCL